MKFLWSQSHWALKEFIGPTSSLYTELAGPINSLSAQNLTMELAAIKKILAGIILIPEKTFLQVCRVHVWWSKSCFSGTIPYLESSHNVLANIHEDTRKNCFFSVRISGMRSYPYTRTIVLFFFCYCYHILFDRFAKKVTQVDRHLMKARGYKAAITTKIGTIVCVQIM